MRMTRAPASFSAANAAGETAKTAVEARELKNIIPLLKKNALRNPVVEKILNQMINVVNALKIGRAHV